MCVDSETVPGIKLPSHTVLKPKATVYDDGLGFDGIGVGENLLFRRSDEHGVRLDMKESCHEEWNNSISENPRTLLFNELKYPRFEIGDNVYSFNMAAVGVVHCYGLLPTGSPTYNLCFCNDSDNEYFENTEYNKVEAVHERGTGVCKEISHVLAEILGPASDDDGNFCYEVVVEKGATPENGIQEISNSPLVTFKRRTRKMRPH